MKFIKSSLPVIVILFVAIAFFAFRSLPNGSVKGSVTPPDAAVRAWALSATDTFKATISGGVFEIADAKPGTYRIIIEATKPYKSKAKEDVVIAEGVPTDIGIIELVKDSTTVNR